MLVWLSMSDCVVRLRRIDANGMDGRGYIAEKLSVLGIDPM